MAGGNQNNNQDTQMTSAEQHSTDSYYGRMASAEQHDAGHQHQYDHQANEQAPQDYEAHYGYEQFDERQDMTYDDIYGGELGDY